MKVNLSVLTERDVRQNNEGQSGRFFVFSVRSFKALWILYSLFPLSVLSTVWMRPAGISYQSAGESQP